MGRVIRKDGDRVVPAEVFDAREEAARIVEEARAEAARIREEASGDARRLRAEAVETGRAEGRAEAAALLAAVTEARDRTLAGGEEDLVRLAMAAARRILAEELALSPDRIRTLVQGVLARARRAARPVVRVHPEDAEQVRAMSGTGSTPELRVEEDPAIERGGCVVQTEHGVLDARIEVQLEALARALLGGTR